VTLGKDEIKTLKYSIENIFTFSVVPLLSSYRVSTIIEKRGKNEH
jgi:hypothetical protein